MANSQFTCACARQMHFTDAQKIYWMHGCPSACIIRVHALHGAKQLVSKNISTLLANQIAGFLDPFYNSL